MKIGKLKKNDSSNTDSHVIIAPKHNQYGFNRFVAISAWQIYIWKDYRQ